MGELAQKFLNAQGDVTSAKAEKIGAVADAKAQLFAAPETPAEFNKVLQNKFDEAGDLIRNSPANTRRVVKEQDNVLVRADNSISIRLHDGRILDDVNPDFVPELLAREQEKLEAIQKGASKSDAVNRVTGLTQEVVNIFKGVGTSGFEVGREAIKTSTGEGTVGGTQQTLTGALQNFNAGVRANRHGGTLNIPEGAKTISPNAVIDFKEIVKRVNKGTPLSPALEEFSKTDTFKTIFSLDREVRASNATISKIDDTADFIKSFVPTDRTDSVGAALAFKRVAENEGTLAGIKNTITNDLGTLVGQGFESIPYMLAFTIGGPVTQIAVLGGLSKAKARELTDTFIDENGVEPTPDELSRIEAFSAVSTIAEKFGDMVALKAISRAKLPRVLNLRKITQGLLPPSIQNFLARPVVAGTLAATGLSTRVGQRTAKALTGEAASGASTSAADQFALSGHIDDPSQIAFDALAEAVGTVGGLGGIVGGRGLVGLLNATKNTVDTLRADAGSDPKTPPSNTPGSPPPAGGNILLADPEPAVTERIEVSDFDKVIEDIQELINDVTPKGIREAFLKLKRLGNRELTEDQAEKHRKALVDGIGKFEDLSTREQEGGILGSLGPIDQISKEDLQELATNRDTTETDKIFIDSILEAQELADEITSDSVNTQEIEKTNKPAVIEDFNNLLGEIQGVASDTTFRTAETKATRTSNLISQLGVKLNNIQNQLSAIIAASKFPTKAGAATVIRATRVNPEDPNDLTEEFSKPISLTEAQIIEEKEAEGANSRIIRVGPTNAEAQGQIATLNKEVEFGNLIVELANSHGDTSFARSTANQGATQRLAADAARQLKAQAAPTISTEKVDAEIESIQDPVSKTVINKEDPEFTKLLKLEQEAKDKVTKAKEKANSISDTVGKGSQLNAALDEVDVAKTALKKATQDIQNKVLADRAPAKKKTPAQELLDPTESTDIADKNRKLWENILVTVDDGTTETAGKLWDTLHRELEMAENLLECVK